MEASQEMVEELQKKESADPIPVHIGSFGEFDIKGRFKLVYAVFNTFFALTDQEAQIRCFQSVSRHLDPDGVFLIEAFVPDLGMFDRGQSVRLVDLTLDSIRLNTANVDPAAQVVESHQALLSPEGFRTYPVRLRYAWPSELDLMARLGGMKLSERWADWEGPAFDGESGGHVSSYSLSDA
jgi:hypothetical protein